MAPIMMERIVNISVNGFPLPAFLCTPEALDDLAVGYLLTQGHIANATDIETVAVDGLRVAVTTNGPLRPAPALEARIDALSPVAVKPFFSMRAACSLMRELAEVEVYYGTHCIALKASDALHFREDIGRHNAMDKVIGRGARDGVDFSHAAVAVTGRISLEMLLKAASVGIPYIITKKYPSDLAVQIAEETGFCIIGSALSGEPVVHSSQKLCHKDL